MRRQITASLALSTTILFACGGSQPAASSPSTGGDTSAAGTPNVPATEAPKFDDLSKDKKVEVMATRVVPNVGKLFKELDGKKFEKFGCVTCHGPEKKDDPHNVLPKLTFSNGGFEKLVKEEPEMMKFMGEKVVPAMASALGEKPYDPATKQGFGCMGCHAID